VALAGIFGPEAIGAQVGEIQKRLDRQLADPQINDQRLSPAEYSNFSKVIKGFRFTAIP
jgi:hypothetical protein